MSNCLNHDFILIILIFLIRNLALNNQSNQLNKVEILVQTYSSVQEGDASKASFVHFCRANNLYYYSLSSNSFVSCIVFKKQDK